MGWKFWKREPTSVAAGPRVMAAVPLKLAMDDQPPFSGWQPPDVEIKDEHKELFQVSVMGYLFYIYLVLIEAHFSEAIGAVVQKELVTLLKEAGGALGDQMALLLGIINTGMNAALEKPVEVPGHPELDLPIEYPIALAALVNIEESPHFVPEMKRKKGQTPEVDDGLDWDLALCLAQAKDNAMQIFKPMVAVMEVDEQEFAEWLDERLEEDDSDLVWSDTPGCYERHLQRKWNNPLFPEQNRKVGQSAIYDAVLQDITEADKLREEVQGQLAAIGKLPTNVGWEEVSRLREQIDDLLHKAASIGGDIDDIVESLTKLRATLIDSAREALKGDKDALRTLEEAEEFHHTNVAKFNNEFIAQMSREDTPIAEDEILPSLLSEEPETIRLVMQVMDQQGHGDAIRNSVHELLAETLADGARIPDLEKKKEALGIPS